MKKLIFTIGILLFLTACSASKYRKVSDIIVGLYKSPIYDSSNLSANENAKVSDFLNKLRQGNTLYTIEEHMVYSLALKANEPDSPEVVIRDNKCLVDFSKLDFEELPEEDGGFETVVICKGYYVNLSRDYFPPAYDDMITSPVYDYRFVDYIIDGNTYKFMYESRYDETGFSVYIKESNGEISEITTVFENIVIPPNPIGSYILAVITLIAVATVAVYLLKKQRKRANRNAW